MKVIWTEEKKNKAISVLTKYFEEHGIGEQIMQSDSAIVEAPEALSDIVDDILIYGEGIVDDDEEKF